MFIRSETPNGSHFTSEGTLGLVRPVLMPTVLPSEPGDLKPVCHYPLLDDPRGKGLVISMNCNAEYIKSYNLFLDPEGTLTMKDRLKLQKELMEQMPVSFPDALAYIMKGRFKEEDLAEKSYLSVSTIARLRSEERLSYNLDQIIAICVAMHLPPWLSEALLDRAHLDIKRYGPFGYYREILDCHFMEDIDTVQAFLIDNGLKPLAIRL